MAFIWSLNENNSELSDVRHLILMSFQYMDTRIDPPSSAHTLTVETLKSHCKDGGVIWAFGTPITGCVLLRPDIQSLHLGKLAVAPNHRGQGIAKALVEHAEKRASTLGFQALELETRVELTENHRVFSRLGFTIVGTASHDGYDRPTEFILRKDLSSSEDRK